MNIVITGASRGIGFSVTKAFVHKGNHRIFVLARNAKNLNKLVTDCNQMNQHSEIIAFSTDLNNSTELKETVERILSISSTIDILINNAGFALRKSFESINTSEIELLMNTNFHAPANLIHMLLPGLLKAGNSHVVNISSIAGFQGSKKFPGLAYYGASKAALASLTEALAEEYKGRGISFNCLALGAVQTEMFSEVFPNYKAPVNPEVIAEFIAEFASNAHNYLQGKTIPVSMSDP